MSGQSVNIRLCDISKAYTFQSSVRSRFLVTRLSQAPARFLDRILLGKRETPDLAPTLDSTFWALKNVSFSATGGEVIGLIGRNGAGKSTLMQIIGRVIRPTAGTFEVEGRLSCLLEAGTGFHWELSGLENIYLNGVLNGMSRREVARKVDSIIEFSELRRFIHEPLKHYSKGMYFRLGFSIALHVEPQIFLLDEIFSASDDAFKAKCLDKIQQMKGKDRLFIVTSHSVNFLNRFCTRVIWLDNGRIIADGDPIETLTKYEESNLEVKQKNLRELRGVG